MNNSMKTMQPKKAIHRMMAMQGTLSPFYSVILFPCYPFILSPKIQPYV